MIVQMHGILDADRPSALARLREEVDQALDHSPMKRANRRHIYDFSIEQFHARVWAQHAGFRHAVVLLHAETMFGRCEHGAKLANHCGICNPTFAATCATSLSPRPERFTMMNLSLASFGARWMTSAIAWADSSAGMMPSSRPSFMNA